MSGASERLIHLLLHPPEGKAPAWMGEALLLAWDLDKEVRQAEFKMERLQKDKAILSSLLTKTSRDLEESLLTQKCFLASVSHEIRTPLNALTGFVELLHDTPLNDRQQSFVENCLSSSRHLLALINDVLDVTRIESGQLLFCEEEAALEDLLLDAVVLTAGKAGNRNVHLRVDIPGLNYFVMADPVRIKQIFINLLGNAFKFTEAGEIRLALLAAEDAGETVRFRVLVEDTGIGIPAAKLGQLFSPFRQAHASHYGGTGLGLYLSRALARLMDGDVTVESREGEGSRFHVAFSLRKGCQKELAFDFGGRNILLAGRDQAQCDDLSGKLRTVGAQVLEMPASEKIFDALDFCRTAPPLHAAILDVGLFGGKCHYFAELLRELHPGIFILGVTGGEEGRNAPEFNSLLLRPFSFHKLADEIHHALHNQHRAGRSLEALSELSVLVVDDIEMNIQLMQEILKTHFNIKPDVARSGEEAVSMVRRSAYNIVFMDVQMPLMDGLDATREIRTFNPTLPIVGLSANAFADDMEKAGAAGMSGYLTKPMKRSDLEKVLFGVLRGKSVLTQALAEPPAKPEKFLPAPPGGTLRQTAHDRLTREYGAEIATGVIAASRESLRSLLADIEAGFGREDAGEVQAGFHSLKGLFLSLWMDEPGRQAAAIEAALKAGGTLGAAREKSEAVFHFARNFLAEISGEQQGEMKNEISGG